MENQFNLKKFLAEGKLLKENNEVEAKLQNLNQYVGRKVKGVKFNSRQYNDIAYVLGMDKHIGHEGVIAAYKESDHSFRIEFETPVKDYWFYPVEVILPQLEGE